VFLSHGTQDRSLPIAGSRAIAPMFEMDGYEVRYEEFEGGHEMPPTIVRRALDWFLA
jgi:predicted esterase